MVLVVGVAWGARHGQPIGDSGCGWLDQGSGTVNEPCRHALPVEVRDAEGGDAEVEKKYFFEHLRYRISEYLVPSCVVKEPP